MRIILYKPAQEHDSYTVICQFVDELAKGFVTLGHDAYVLDCNRPIAEQELHHLFSLYSDGIITFGALPGIRLESGQSIYEQYEIPLVMIRVDHPLNNPAWLQLVSRQMITLMDPSHVREMPFHFGSSMNSIFLPHGGCTGGIPTPYVEKERPIDLLFSARYTDPEEILIRTRDWHFPLPGIFQEMCQEALSQHTVPFLQVVQHAFSKRGLTYDYQLMYVGHLLQQAWDLYIRAVRRKEFLLALESAGIAVDVYGKGWEKYPTLGLHRFHGELGFAQVIPTLAQAKVLINAGTNLPEGSHERVLTGMIAGAAIVTEETLFFKEQFGGALRSYRLTGIEEGVKHIRELLDQSVQRIEMAEQAQKMALGRHTWLSRARSLVTCLSDF